MILQDEQIEYRKGEKDVQSIMASSRDAKPARAADTQK